MPDTDKGESPEDKKRREEFAAWQQKEQAEKGTHSPQRPVLNLPNKDGKTPKPPFEGEDVTYLPGPGDPSTVTWRGNQFQANVPVRLKHAEHIAAVRGNKFFRVGSGEPNDNPNRDPEDADEYKAHVVNWMSGVTRIEQVMQKWSADRALREKCEVGDDEIKYLATLIEPRLKHMRMAESLTEMQVAELWVKYGTLNLPWRAT